LLVIYYISIVVYF